MSTRNITMRIGDKNYKIVIPGTADAISFKNDSLQIHDLKKTGDVPAHTEQLMMYEAAASCVITVSDAMELYILDAERNHTVKPSTIKTYRNFYENYFSLIKDMPISQVSLNHIQESVEEEATHLRQSKTIRNAYSFLKKVLNVYRPDLIFTKGALVYPSEIEGVVYKA